MVESPSVSNSGANPSNDTEANGSKSSPGEESNENGNGSKPSPGEKGVKAAPEKRKRASKPVKQTIQEAPVKKTKLADMTPARRNRIRLTEKKIKETEAEIAELEAKAASMSKKFSNVKWPVRDEDVVKKLILAEVCKSSKVKEHTPYNALQQALPAPEIPILLKNQELASEVIFCWDFINTFEKELELMPISLEHFIDLMQFQGKDSGPFTEIFTAPLRVILNDLELSTKLSLTQPIHMNFARKLNEPEKMIKSAAGYVAPQVKAAGTVNAITVYQERTTRTMLHEIEKMNTDVDTLLPRALTGASVDALNWQVILAQFWRALPPMNKVLGLNAALVSASTTDTERGTNGVSYIKKKMEEMDMAKNMELNLDSALSITSDVGKSMSMLKQAMTLLMNTDLYKASTEMKVYILRVMFETCYDTKLFRDLLQEYSVKRASAATQERKRIAQEKEKEKLDMKDVIQRAEDICREENRTLKAIKEEARAEAQRRAAELKAKKATAKSKGGKGGGKPPAAPKEPKVIEKKGKEKKDEFKPTPSQLNNKVEELVILKAYNVDEVGLFTTDEVSDDEAGDTRAMSADKAFRRKQNEDWHAEIATAEEILQDALESGREDVLTKAVKSTKKSLIWDDDGYTYCTEVMRNAMKAEYMYKKKAQQNKAEAEFDSKLDIYSIRSEVLGYDRYYNEYYCFRGDSSRLYVKVKGGNATNMFGSMDHSEHLTNNPALKVMFDKRPTITDSYAWGIYGSPREIYKLCEALDDRGMREKALKEKIRGKFELEEPVEYQTNHDWIGRRVKRTFKSGGKPTVGVIDGWLPEDIEEDDQALWHVKYKDGDQEELDEDEVKRFLIEEDVKFGFSTNSDSLQNLQPPNKAGGKRQVHSYVPIANFTIGRVSDVKEHMDKYYSEVLHDEPEVLTAYRNTYIGTGKKYDHKIAKNEDVGLPALQMEFTFFVETLKQTVKESKGVNPWTRDEEAALKLEINSATEASELAGVLVRFETVVRIYI